MPMQNTAEVADESREQKSSPSGTILEGYLHVREFCRELGVTARTERNWRRRGIGPPFVQVGRDIFISIEGVRSWLKRREIDPSRRMQRRAARRHTGEAL